MHSDRITPNIDSPLEPFVAQCFDERLRQREESVAAYDPLTWHGLLVLGPHSPIAVLLSLSSATKWIGLIILFGLCVFAAGWQTLEPREPDRVSRPALT